MANINLSGSCHGEEMSGWLKDEFQKVKSKVSSKLSTMPKWKRILLVGVGLGAVSPTLATTALTTAGAAAAIAIPTALAAVPVAATIIAARKAKGIIQARIAAKKAAGQDTSADEQQLAQVSDVANQQLPPNGPQTEGAASTQLQHLEQTHGSGSTKTVATIAAVGGLGLLSFLPALLKRH